MLGNRLTGGAGSRNDLWLFAADGSDAGPHGGRNLSARHDLMPGSGMNSDVTRGETSRLWPSPDGKTISFTAPLDGALRAVAADRRRRRRRAADRRPALPQRLGRRRRRARSAALRLPALDADEPARPVAPGRGGGAAPPDRVQRRGPRRAQPRRAGRAPLGGRRPDDPGLVHPGLGRQPRAGDRDPRRAAHPVRLVAGLGVPDPRRQRDGRLLLQPARLGGLRRGVQRRQPPRLGSRPDARRHRRHRVARRRRAGRSAAPGRDRWVVRRLPDQLDRSATTTASRRR